ncbi:hypothetical protein J2X03_003807 [Microbacterium trichothecenolyticum]|uniref:hypothetical protein n=1 Tax=Microbacterium trichothecenolyticum TaxID=69370 RepID=UPI0028652480|nr:hypothetical protein [Microbacterium trichothecenolyticum]MDR7113905.1 hypothetical protein [Microbacterium trichothecenolyticum]
MSRSEGREARAMEAASFFDRWARSAATSPRAVAALKRELPLPEQYVETVRVQRSLEAEMKRGRRTIAAERERWLAESRATA